MVVGTYTEMGSYLGQYCVYMYMYVLKQSLVCVFFLWKVELSRPCSERALFLCSQKMTDWKRLAPPLGLTHPEAMQIE